MKTRACPECGAQTLVAERGVLILEDCSACGWSGGGIGNPAFPELGRSVSVEVRVRAARPLVAEALLKLRQLSEPAKALPLSVLSSRLAHEMSLGEQAPHEVERIRQTLEPLGFEVLCRPYR